jgi:tripartite-type tricarboxylate transporter receptor subunit TctC
VRAIAVSAIAAAVLFVAFPSLAQDYPSQPIRLVLGYPAGVGGADTVTRQLANAMKDLAKQPVIVENKPGAQTNIAADYVAKAKPNGYTIFITAGNSTFAAGAHLYKNLPFDPVKSFVPVATLTRVPFVLMVSNSQKIFTVQDLTRILKAKRDKGSYGSSTPIGLVISELYKSIAGLETVQIGYKSLEPAWPELQSGGLDFMFVDPANAAVAMKSNRARGIAVTSAQRFVTMPDLPTMIEGGVPGYDVTSWLGAYAPAGTPRPIVEKLSGWFNEVMARPEYRKALANINYDVFPGTPDEALKFHLAELDKWGRLIKAAKIEAQ